MKDLIVYIGLSGICIGIFFLIYRLFLRTCTSFRFNRAFLVVGLIASFILPAMRFSYEIVLPVSVTSIADTSAATMQAIPKTFAIDVWDILAIIYLIGVAVQLLRNLLSYRKVTKLIRSGVLTKTDHYTIADNPQIASPFTVFNCIAINTKNMSVTEKDLILKHEITHISQKHWIDLICSECALLLQWFNPLMWLYVSSLKENHEFLADKAVIEAGISPALYQATLINQRFQGPVFSFSNSFHYPNQLNRLFMIKKTKTSPWRRIAVLALIPSFGIFFWASATPHYTFMTVGGSTPPQDSIKIVGYQTDKDISSKMNDIDNASENVLCIIDGKKSSLAEMKKLEANDISSIHVLKDKTAIKPYGEKGKNGVILVMTKKGVKSIQFTPPVIKKDKPSTKKGTSTVHFTPPVITKDPLVYIDGKESDYETFQAIHPNRIEEVAILKDSQDLVKYGEKGKGGVILVTLKKEYTTNHDLYKYLIILDDGKEISTRNSHTIDPSKIEKFEVLNEEEATQKYGEKGKNGIILVTLKKY